MIAVILGLDPGETTGCSTIVISEDKKISVRGYGTIPNMNSDLGERLVATRNFVLRAIADLCEEHEKEIVHVAVEMGLPGSVISKTEAHEVRGVIREAVTSAKMPYHGYYPATIKKEVRHGKMSKAEVRRWIGALLGLGAIKSPDEADALAVASCCARKQFGAQFPVDVVNLPEKSRGGKKEKITGPSVSDLTPQEVSDGIAKGTIKLIGKRAVWSK